MAAFHVFGFRTGFRLVGRSSSTFAPRYIEQQQFEQPQLEQPQLEQQLEQPQFGQLQLEQPQLEQQQLVI